MSTLSTIEYQTFYGVDYYLPADENEVIELVNDAQKNNEIICVRGSGHSFPLINTLEQQQSTATGRKYKFLMLSKMNKVTIEGDTVKVKAGCHLGKDPWDPTGYSTDENSLLFQLDQQGLALPDLGGISHQTVGGFLSTASSGGSVKYSFEDAIISVDIVTCQEGKGAAITTFTRPEDENPDDPFFGAGIATMGLFGVIVSATFKCIPNFYLKGSETTSTEAACAIDLFNQSPADLEAYLRKTDYARLMWWPQAGVTKMVVWEAFRTTYDDAVAWTNGEKGCRNRKDSGGNSTQLRPYEEVPYIGCSPTPVTLAADLLFTAMGRWPVWVDDILANDPGFDKTFKNTVEETFYPLILPGLLGIFVTDGVQKFSDNWYEGLPMDNQMSDRLFPVWFTELWIPLENASDVMQDLKAFYGENPSNAGTFSCEIYAAQSNNFWLSPSYNTDVIRIDVFWFGNNIGNPADYFNKFWQRLAKFNFRPHWGKYLPDANSSLGVEYLENLYPKWQDWKDLRHNMDPGEIFVNDYWRAHLGI